MAKTRLVLDQSTLHFFMKDVIKRENINIKHCPTESMIADYLTKPTQGSLLRKQRGLIMGITSITIEEHVGINENSIDEECKKGVKNRTAANQKSGKQVQYRCRIF